MSVLAPWSVGTSSIRFFGCNPFGEMDSTPNGWILDYNITDEEHASDFMWVPPFIRDQELESDIIGLEVGGKEGGCSDKTCSKKRVRTESYVGPGTKACREKMRRDRLNDRFLELCSILDPGRPPKTDKVVILSDVTRLLNQLRVETQNLKETNEALQNTIKSLKAEKMELRDEKVRLKAEKEKIEQVLKGMNARPSFMLITFQATAAFAMNSKAVPYPYYPPTTMWQWMPPAALDTSQDHVLRPPVA